jgi:hypothetical protein
MMSPRSAAGEGQDASDEERAKGEYEESQWKDRKIDHGKRKCGLSPE